MRSTKSIQQHAKVLLKYCSSTTALVLIPSLLYVIRAWQYIARPQLFAEDGAVWLADAYNHGLKSIFMPYNGFAHTTERVFALLVACFPLKFAPLLFNLAGFVLFVLISYYLFSRRSTILTTNFQRLFVALGLGLIANFTEFFFNFSNSVFLLGVIGLCIYLAKPSRRASIRLLEKLVFVLACLTLLFACFYLPIILFEQFRLKKQKIFYLVASGIGTVIQLCAVIFNPRPTIPLSTLIGSKYTLIEIFNQIITPAITSSRLYFSLMLQAHDFLPILVVCVLIIGLSLYVTIRHASLELKYLVFFIVGFTAVGIKGPLIDGGVTGVNALKFMATTPEENRYFFYGILCLLIIIALAVNTYLKRQAAYVFLAVFMAFGLSLSIASRSWTVHKNLSSNYSNAYSQDILKLGNVKRGTVVVIPENPTGWSIDLRSK